LSTIDADAGSVSRPANLRKEFTTNKYQITEALAKGADTILLLVAVLPQHLLKELIDHARSFGMEPLVEVHIDVDTRGTKMVKVCGITNPEDALVVCQAGANLIGVIFVPKRKRYVSTEEGSAVVDAVRTFGERTARTTVRTSSVTSPISQVVSNARALEEASKRPLVVGVFRISHPSTFEKWWNHVVWIWYNCTAAKVWKPLVRKFVVSQRFRNRQGFRKYR